MALLERRRTLRPSSREESSPYKVDTKKVMENDTLVIYIDHEDNPGRVLYKYQISGKLVAHRKSISFKANGSGENWNIIWSGETPTRLK